AILLPDLRGRQTQAFLEIIEDAFHALAAGPRAADVRVVQDVHREPDELAAVERRLRDEEVGQVPGAEQRIVQHDRIAGLERLAHETVSTIKLAYSSTPATVPGGSTEVDSRSSTMAGPSMREPGTSA